MLYSSHALPLPPIMYTLCSLADLREKLHLAIYTASNNICSFEFFFDFSITLNKLCVTLYSILYAAAELRTLHQCPAFKCKFMVLV